MALRDRAPAPSSSRAVAHLVHIACVCEASSGGSMPDARTSFSIKKNRIVCWNAAGITRSAGRLTRTWRFPRRARHQQQSPTAPSSNGRDAPNARCGGAAEGPGYGGGIAR